MTKYLTHVLIIALGISCSGIKAPTQISQYDEPYLLVISIDGYRWDYTNKYQPPFLSHFEKEGASLVSLRPSYPTDTFPNHLTMMTGLYPDHHGIVANTFYSPKLQKKYSLHDRASQANGRFYSGKPFWELAQNNHLKSAVMFWPGSEAAINGKRPDYFYPYTPAMSHAERIGTVMSWFKLPIAQRPRFIAMYFDEVDIAGHAGGPDSQGVKAAIMKVDQSLRDLSKLLGTLDFKVHVVIVSDHGIAATNHKQSEKLTKNKSQLDRLKKFTIIEQGAHIHLYKKVNIKISLLDTKNLLNKTSQHFKCYLKGEAPKDLNYGHHKSAGDIFCLAERNWVISNSTIKGGKGRHGWSQHEGMDMHGILYASGQKLKNQFKYKTLDNVNLYPLMAKILQIEIKHKIDGDSETIAPLFIPRFQP